MFKWMIFRCRWWWGSDAWFVRGQPAGDAAVPAADPPARRTRGAGEDVGPVRGLAELHAGLGRGGGVPGRDARAPRRRLRLQEVPHGVPGRGGMRRAPERRLLPERAATARAARAQARTGAVQVRAVRGQV